MRMHYALCVQSLFVLAAQAAEAGIQTGALPQGWVPPATS